MVYQKKKYNEKGQIIENPSNFNFDCPNSYKYSLVPSQDCGFKGECWIEFCALTSVGMPNL